MPSRFLVAFKGLNNFFRNHMAGIIVFAIATGVAGNFVYDAVKPKDVPAATNVPPTDWHSAAQALRLAASSLRSIAGNHMRYPPPKKWLEAEATFKRGSEQYSAADFEAAYTSFKQAHLLYQDLYEEAQAAGH